MKRAWSWWFLALWGVVAVIVLCTFFLTDWSLPARVAIAVVLFGTMEWLGMRVEEDRYPPLTQAIRHYVPRWAAFTLLFFLMGLVIFPTWPKAACFGGVGWVLSHFDTTYDNPG